MGGGDYFCFSVQESGAKTTKYFSAIVKVSSLLMLLDRYLLSIFKLKQQVSHLLLNDDFTDRICIQEETAYGGDIGGILRCFLKSGKELFLSSLQQIETTRDLDDILKRLSDLAYQVQEELRSQDFLDVLTHSRLDRIAFARQVHLFWLYFANSGSSNPIILESVAGLPRVAFTKKPPLREWLPKNDERTQVDRLELRHIDFGDSKRWKAVLFGYLHDRPMIVEIEDLKFLDSLKSTEQNEENGILNGDILLARYTTIYDPLLNKTTVNIHEVHGRARQSQATQLGLFAADTSATTEMAAKPAEKPQKPVKKKHSSWR